MLYNLFVSRRGISESLRFISLHKIILLSILLTYFLRKCFADILSSLYNEFITVSFCYTDIHQNQGTDLCFNFIKQYQTNRFPKIITSLRLLLKRQIYVTLHSQNIHNLLRDVLLVLYKCHQRLKQHVSDFSTCCECLML